MESVFSPATDVNVQGAHIPRYLMAACGHIGPCKSGGAPGGADRVSWARPGVCAPRCARRGGAVVRKRFGANRISRLSIGAI
jgi:hypothetical protein